MKLIIDIPEETYEIIENINYFYNMSRITDRIEKQEIVLAIKNGTSLEEELEKIKAKIGLYENDCMLSCPNNDDCRDCNNNMFGSIYRIIDKHISELKGENNG